MYDPAMRLHSRLIEASAVLAALLGASACSTLPNGRLWGDHATLTPGWSQVRESAVRAGRDPWVWMPLLGAAAFQIDDWDARTANWAREHTIVFGSQRSAEDWSDRLRNAARVAHYVTIVATPGGDEPGAWLVSKARGTLVDVAAVSSTVFVTRTLKTATDRERPNGLADESFPSGHTSSAAVHTRLASRNLRTIAMDDGVRSALDIGLYAMTVGTSWARIEAGWHYPSDTLIGMALGNFIASFVNDAFLGTSDSTAIVALTPSHDGALVHWRWRF
jgi:membrane-associated phospholipid phosphatase